jgi:hypothetical protein
MCQLATFTAENGMTGGTFCWANNVKLVLDASGQPGQAWRYRYPRGSYPAQIGNPNLHMQHSSSLATH